MEAATFASEDPSTKKSKRRFIYQHATPIWTAVKSDSSQIVATRDYIRTDTEKRSSSRGSSCPGRSKLTVSHKIVQSLDLMIDVTLLRSLDARNGNLTAAIHWAVSDDLGRRTYFQIGDGQRAKLKVTKVTLQDQGVFRCRVDFVNSPTRNFRINLTLVGNYRISKRASVGCCRAVTRFASSRGTDQTCDIRRDGKGGDGSGRPVSGGLQPRLDLSSVRR